LKIPASATSEKYANSKNVQHDPAKYSMARYFVRILADVHCNWEGLTPVYRLYVNDELFTERTWEWTDCYLEEIVGIEAEPGDYYLRWELVQPCLAQLDVTNMRVDYGTAQVLSGNTIRICDAAT